MNEVQWDVLDALLQMLLGKGLISRTVYDKSHEKNSWHLGLSTFLLG